MITEQTFASDAIVMTIAMLLSAFGIFKIKEGEGGGDRIIFITGAMILPILKIYVLNVAHDYWVSYQVKELLNGGFISVPIMNKVLLYVFQSYAVLTIASFLLCLGYGKEGIFEFKEGRILWGICLSGFAFALTMSLFWVFMIDATDAPSTNTTVAGSLVGLAAASFVIVSCTAIEFVRSELEV